MEKAPTHLDLFSGIGGFALAAQWAGFRTVAFCEIDGYCHKVLAKNFMAKSESERLEGRQQQQTQLATGCRPGQSGSPPTIYSNIFNLNGRNFAGVSLITGGFPCQPFSVAGKRRGAADDRAIWPEMFRVINEARPAWVLGENVPGIIPMELDNVLSDLEGIGYATRAFNIGAVSVDARHRRQRIWIIGKRIVDGGTDPHSVGTGLEGRGETRDLGGEGTGREELPAGLCGTQAVANAEGTEREGQRGDARGRGSESGRCCRWQPEPDVGRVANGVPKRLDGGLDEALRVLWQGNGSTEMVKREIGRHLEESSVLFNQMLRRLDHLAQQGETDKWPKEGAKETQNGEMRGLWLSQWFAAASSRQESTEQRIIQPSGVMPEMPQGRSSEGRDMGAIWIQEPDVPRVAHGVKDRVNRLKGLGNAIVPQVAYEILREIRRLIQP